MFHEDNQLINLLKSALTYFDHNNIKYKDFINDDNVEIKSKTNQINFIKKKKNYNYNILGILDNNTNVWIWGWLLPHKSFNEKKKVIDLLNYGLKISLNYSEKISTLDFYLKTQLLNSRFLLNDNIQLDIHLALSAYLLKKQSKFIYPYKRYLNEDKTKYLTIYYIIF